MKTGIALLLLVLLVEALLLRLGFWQLARGDEKQAQSAALQVVLRDKRPMQLAQAVADAEGYTWVDGQVRLLPEPLLLLDNQRKGTAVGVNVYQIGIAADGQALLIDLGWLPVAGERSLPKPEALSGTYRLSGLLLPPPSMGYRMGPALTEQADGSWLLMRLDRVALAERLQRPLAARVLRPDPALDIGFARNLDVQANTLPPEKHRAYALQWFGLAAAWLILWFYVARRKKT
ncbi:MAG: SURF1 family protein [Arenimonas sp.]|nr:SURF1 family protein [Arenimonas sp.]MBP7981418.1 SURF1 family protein [Arenimonas sp.]